MYLFFCDLPFHPPIRVWDSFKLMCMTALPSSLLRSHLLNEHTIYGWTFASFPDFFPITNPSAINISWMSPMQACKIFCRRKFFLEGLESLDNKICISSTFQENANSKYMSTMSDFSSLFSPKLSAVLSHICQFKSAKYHLIF